MNNKQELLRCRYSYLLVFFCGIVNKYLFMYFIIVYFFKLQGKSTLVS